MGTSLLRFQLWLLAAVSIVTVGWKKPLGSLFTPPPPPVVELPAPAWQPAGTALDRAPYVKKNGVVSYTSNIDPHKMGSATETTTRPNLISHPGQP